MYFRWHGNFSGNYYWEEILSKVRGKGGRGGKQKKRERERLKDL